MYLCATPKKNRLWHLNLSIPMFQKLIQILHNDTLRLTFSFLALTSFI